MKIKNTFSFDEERDAKDILENGFKNGKFDYSKIYIVAKYLRDVMHYGETRLERELIRFCESQDPNFNPITEADLIRKWVKSAMNYSLRKIDSISISQKDIDFLKTIISIKDRKLLFATLIMAKAIKKSNTKRKSNIKKVSENYYVRNNNFLDIIRLSKLKNIKEVDLADVLHKYKSYFTFYYPEKELIRLNFVDKNPSEKIIINDLENLSEYFENIFGESKNNKSEKNISYCINCGNQIIKRNNNQKYCTACSKVIKNKKDKERMRLKYENMRNIQH